VLICEVAEAMVGYMLSSEPINIKIAI